MAGSWLMVWGLFAVVGAPLLSVGVILRCCEWSWQMKRGELGSRRLMLAGLTLMMPAVAYLAVAMFPG